MAGGEAISHRSGTGERKDREESAHPEIGNNTYKRNKGTTPHTATHSVDEESSGATESHTHPGTEHLRAPIVIYIV